MMCTDGGTIEAVHTAHSHCLSLLQATMTQAKSTMKTTAGAPYRLQHSLVVSTTLNEVNNNNNRPRRLLGSSTDGIEHVSHIKFLGVIVKF